MMFAKCSQMMRLGPKISRTWFCTRLARGVKDAAPMAVAV